MTIAAPQPDATTQADAVDLAALLDRLTLEEKVALVSGRDFWTTVALPSIGLRAMTLSDGPAGVRGPQWDERSPSINLPSGTALAASWDPQIAYRYGAVAAAEARRKDVDVVLGPTINLHRSPLGGRHFECFSEDPLLSGVLAAAYVRGLQENGVAATPKHYVANDSETDRFTVDVRVDERALRELYLLPFEHAVEAGAWAVMSAYNSVDGVTMSENELLETPLNSEWGFDGVVVSDWTAVRSLDSVPAAQDLAMPGPAPAWADALLAAVRDGRVAEADVDRKVLRMLRLAARVGALDVTTAVVPAAVDAIAVARESAVEGTVLLRNEGVLPLDAAALGSVAVIGHNAIAARTQGGGSATVIPEHVVTPLDGIRAALPDAAVAYAVGAIVQEGVSEIPLAQLHNPETGEPGIVAEFLDASGAVLFAENRRSTALVWFGGDAPIETAAQVRYRFRLTPQASETVALGFATSARGRVTVDGVLVLDEQPIVEGTDLGAAFLAPPSATAEVALTEGVARDIEVLFDPIKTGTGLDGAFAATVGMAPPTVDAEELIREAAALAARSDVAIIVVGTNARVESEGYDRADLSLPGRQDDLVRAVAAANPRTIVIVNAGAPVLLPWRDEVAGIVLGYFGGQEFGSAVADVVFGAVEPGGRLTTTWPAALDDVPVLDVTPRDGVLRYEEGIHIGYRAWLRAGAEPAWPFGFGLGYTSWELAEATVSGSLADDDLELSIPVANTGDRAGKQVVQVYAERADSAVDRPVRWLVGSAVVRAGAGESATATIRVPARTLSHWDSGWALEPGAYALRVGTSSVDLPLAVEVVA